MGCGRESVAEFCNFNQTAGKNAISCYFGCMLVSRTMIFFISSQIIEATALALLQIMKPLGHLTKSGPNFLSLEGLAV